MSIHGDVKEYTLSEEERLEIIKKYGEPKQPLRTKLNHSDKWEVLTLSRYRILQHDKALNDDMIRKKFKLTKEELRELKKQWGIVKRG